ncbi:hypothetical protein IWW37_000743 [Coemansia sp. RSA 2050]|nr:hypothetical protein IWW37_000743 [Coemansia sp. RSA 2050]KAJ2735893.1 hypothetical protein IW152_001191 [Coemansia sp. BCRC 34962]
MTSAYEEERERQIRENDKFLASLGIKSPFENAPKRKKQPPKRASEEGEYKPDYSMRERKQRVSYNEDSYYSAYPAKKKQTKSCGSRRSKAAPGRRVVGCRVYDSTHGSSCHQCRQKTMDPKIKCSNDGCTVMFDYHCLLGHYSEDAKVVDHSEWVCPKCRGKCNCSVCKKKRGERPTGQISVYIKRFGMEAAKKALKCDVIHESVLKQAASMRSIYEGLEEVKENGYESGNNDTAAGSEKGANTAEPRRYSLRRANSDARKKIASLVEDSDDENTLASWDDEDAPDFSWSGWESCPKNINCIVLI